MRNAPCFICGASGVCWHREPALLSKEESHRLWNRFSTDHRDKPKHANELQIIGDSLFLETVQKKPVEKSGKQPVDVCG